MLDHWPQGVRMREFNVDFERGTQGLIHLVHFGYTAYDDVNIMLDVDSLAFLRFGSNFDNQVGNIVLLC